MADGVLPAGRCSSVIGKLPHDPVVDALYRESLGRGTLHCHEDHAGEGQRRLTGILSIVLPVAHIQNHIHHLVRGPGMASGLERIHFAWLSGTFWLARLPRAPDAAGADLHSALLHRLARQRRAHSRQDAGLLEPAKVG